MVEIRRRLWGHLIWLDVQSAILDGSDALSATISNVQSSLNVNDADWSAARIVSQDLGPPEREGFTDSSCALVRREMVRTYHRVVEYRKIVTSCEELTAMVGESEKSIEAKYLRHFDGSNPMHHVLTHWVKGMSKFLHVLIVNFHSESQREGLSCHSFAKSRTG
jgi:hypothetical protein